MLVKGKGAEHHWAVGAVPQLGILMIEHMGVLGRENKFSETLGEVLTLDGLAFWGLGYGEIP